MNDITTFAFYIVIRLGIPILLTVLAVLALRKLDQKWRANAEANRAQLAAVGLAPRNTGCWNVMGCSEEKRATCKAFAHPDTPCWQVYRSGDGQMQSRCQGCKVFHDAPMPVTA